jgi:hypothetical protein
MVIWQKISFDNGWGITLSSGFFPNLTLLNAIQQPEKVIIRVYQPISCF